jgi:hypothetical protein
LGSPVPEWYTKLTRLLAANTASPRFSVENVGLSNFAEDLKAYYRKYIGVVFLSFFFDLFQ